MSLFFHTLYIDHQEEKNSDSISCNDEEFHLMFSDNNNNINNHINNTNDDDNNNKEFTFPSKNKKFLNDDIVLNSQEYEERKTLETSHDYSTEMGIIFQNAISEDTLNGLLEIMEKEDLEKISKKEENKPPMTLIDKGFKVCTERMINTWEDSKLKKKNDYEISSLKNLLESKIDDKGIARFFMKSKLPGWSYYKSGTDRDEVENAAISLGVHKLRQIKNKHVVYSIISFALNHRTGSYVMKTVENKAGPGRPPEDEGGDGDHDGDNDTEKTNATVSSNKKTKSKSKSREHKQGKFVLLSEEKATEIIDEYFKQIREETFLGEKRVNDSVLNLKGNLCGIITELLQNKEVRKEIKSVIKKIELINQSITLKSTNTTTKTFFQPTLFRWFKNSAFVTVGSEMGNKNKREYSSFDTISVKEVNKSVDKKQNKRKSKKTEKATNTSTSTPAPSTNRNKKRKSGKSCDQDVEPGDNLEITNNCDILPYNATNETPVIYGDILEIKKRKVFVQTPLQPSKLIDLSTKINPYIDRKDLDGLFFSQKTMQIGESVTCVKDYVMGKVNEEKKVVRVMLINSVTENNYIDFEKVFDPVLKEIDSLDNFAMSRVYFVVGIADVVLPKVFDFFEKKHTLKYVENYSVTKMKLNNEPNLELKDNNQEICQSSSVFYFFTTQKKHDINNQKNADTSVHVFSGNIIPYTLFNTLQVLINPLTLEILKDYQEPESSFTSYVKENERGEKYFDECFLYFMLGQSPVTVSDQKYFLCNPKQNSLLKKWDFVNLTL